MQDKDKISFEVEEDDGLDLNKPKVEIIEDEVDTPEQIEKKKKATLKKLYKIGGVLMCLTVLGLVIFLVTRPKEQERELPYSIESGSGIYTANGEIKEGNYSIQEYDATDEYYGLVFNACNLKDKPTSVGGNSLITAEKGESVHILGDVLDKEGNFLNWFYCYYKGKFGYVSDENVEVYDRKGGLMTIEEETTLTETTEEQTEELSEEEKKIKEKAFIKEIENVAYNLSKYDKYELERYSIHKTYTDLISKDGIEWVNQEYIDEQGNKVLAKTTNEHINTIIILLDTFDTLKANYVNANNETEEKQIEQQISELFEQYNSVYGPFLTQEEYDTLKAAEIQAALEKELERNPNTSME